MVLLGMIVHSTGLDTQPPTLDLYIQKIHRNFSGSEHIGRCNACEEDLVQGQGCVLTSMDLWLEGQCHSTSTYPASNYYSRRMVATNDTHVCQERFPGSYDCTSPPQCEADDIYRLDQCYNGQVIQKLDDWCIQSSTPNGPFQVPLVWDRFYRATVNEPPPVVCNIT